MKINVLLCLGKSNVCLKIVGEIVAKSPYEQCDSGGRLVLAVVETRGTDLARKPAARCRLGGRQSSSAILALSRKHYAIRALRRLHLGQPSAEFRTATQAASTDGRYGYYDSSAP